MRRTNMESVRIEKEKAGQPANLTEEEKLVERVASKVLEILGRRICRRCTHTLVTEEEAKRGYCKDCWELVLEQRNHQREEQKLILNKRIEGAKREISFKKNEIDSGSIRETKVTVMGDDGRPIHYEGYVNHVKPEFILHNEIDILSAQIGMYERQLESIRKKEEEDAKTSGTKGEAKAD